MADDIVTRLRKQQWQHHSRSNTFTALADAADEIERLRAELLDWERTVRAHEAENDELHDDLTRLLREVGRLRAAGDALADALRSGSDSGWDKAIDNWEDTAAASRSEQPK